MYYNKNIRFIFWMEEVGDSVYSFKFEEILSIKIITFCLLQSIVTQDNIEAYDLVVRRHEFLPHLDYLTSDRKKFLGIEFKPTPED